MKTCGFSEQCVYHFERRDGGLLPSQEYSRSETTVPAGTRHAYRRRLPPVAFLDGGVGSIVHISSSVSVMRSSVGPLVFFLLAPLVLTLLRALAARRVFQRTFLQFRRLVPHAACSSVFVSRSGFVETRSLRFTEEKPS